MPLSRPVVALVAALLVAPAVLIVWQPDAPGSAPGQAPQPAAKGALPQADPPPDRAGSRPSSGATGTYRTSSWAWRSDPTR